MEPITAAGAFSTIVSLLRIFKQERGDQKKADHQTFMEWLEYHQHKELKNLIVNTAALRTEVPGQFCGLAELPSQNACHGA